ncbi:glycosyltransferase [Algiphilus sp. W345]|uniref:Glycosyltransferase n=1 Tax=Banduia mediterranea TaxID=3075609 RepID=A0ABU2WEB7_9GAMM|nr:glycosyltransferase [Algiphilus sp. W345]MDT0496220.1 glycosyltransferase [Algiphilus sp. W345]
MTLHSGPDDPTAGQLAIVHDYLIQMGGAEQVVASLHKAFPHAPIYTSVVDRKQLLPALREAPIHDSWMRSLPGISRRFKSYFPLYPAAFHSLGTIDCDLALISSSGFSKWARFSPRTIKISYCHTPARFLWMPDQYMEHEPIHPMLKAAAKLMLKPLRQRDYAIAQKIDHFIANSAYIQARIKQFYGRDSTVIHPPVTLTEFSATQDHGGYYLIASRLVGYKRIDIAMKAFSQNGRRLIVVGDGPDRARLQAMAGPSVEFKGWLPRAEMLAYLRNCYAFVFPGLEDFGITPVEAQACGKPVLAFGGGGVLETVVPGLSGMFFDAQSADSLNGRLQDFEAQQWNAGAIAGHAAQFGEARFIRQITQYVDEVLASRGSAVEG